MLRRVLLIGVGGSGGKTLRFLHRELSDRLAGAGWKSGMPVGWQFLQIDVPPTPDGNSPQLPPQLPESSYVPLAVPGVRYQTLDRTLVPGDASPQHYGELVGWRPYPEEVTIDTMAGAGQHRTLGRVIALAKLGDIRDAVSEALERLAQPEAVTELDQISVAFGNEPARLVPQPLAIVVSSLAGGSGSGMFLDVCDALKAFDHGWLETSIALLYAPDVFEDISELGKLGVHPNALAALSELLSGYWNTEPAGATEYELYKSAGIQLDDLKRRGPRYPFIIGRANSRVSFGGQTDVYAGTASALAAILTSARAQDDLTAHYLGNWGVRAALNDTLGLKTALDESPMSSMGFASVSLGRDRFGRYAAERLARLAVERVLRAHWAGRDVPERMKPEDALEEVRRQAFETFVADARLNELGETNNDIIDDLQPEGLSSLLDETTEDVKSRVTAGRDRLRPREWAAAIQDGFSNKEADVLAELRVRTEARARQEWVPETQKRLLELAAKTIAHLGAPVAVALLDSLSDEMSKVIVELGQEKEQRLRWASRRDASIHKEFSTLGDNDRVPSGAEFVNRGIDKGRRTLEWAADAQVRGLALDLARELRDGVITPLRDAVRNAMLFLEREDAPPPGARSPQSIQDWPQGRVLPKRFEPAKNERLIESTSLYPDMFVERVVTSVGVPRTDDAIAQAVREAVIGSANLAEQQVIVQTATWNPSALGGVSTKAKFEVRIRAADLLERAGEWVHRPNTAIGEYVSEPLARYLDPARATPTEIEDRFSRFRAAFTQAVTLAAPLVTINPTVYARTHPNHRIEVDYTFTEMPFPAGTRARDEVEQILQAQDGINPADPRIQGFFGTGEQHRIDILSMLGAPLEPVVFSSIIDPIAADWTARKASAESRRAFWRWRRSRPLPRFVPMSPGIRRNFVIGWFAARALGQIKAGQDDAQPIEVYVPDVRKWLPLPHPLIAPVNGDLDLLPAALESLPLALLDYASRLQSGDAALVPYHRLIRLGDNPQPALYSWILDGRVEEGAPVPPDRVGTADQSPTVRQERILEYVEGRQRRYAKYLDTNPDKHNFFELRWIWELRDDLHLAFRELHRIVVGIGTDEDDRD